MSVKTLADVPAGKVWEAQQAALMRLQLYLVMRTHEMLRAVLADCREALDDAAPEGEWDGLATHVATEAVTKVWRKHFDEWKALFMRLRWEAGAIPFGAWARMHQVQFGAARERLGLGESRTLREGTVVFEPQLQELLDQAERHLWDDGFTLSDRIWRLDQQGLDGIRQVLMEGVANGNSAWNIAKKLEPFLGAGRDCPRWARSRLYKLTKSDIAGGDRTGLYTGEECDGQGLSYYALRLARNEIQVAHHRVTDYLMNRIPWIEKEQVHLSPAHPETDVCDDAISNGENGDGIYLKGTVLLPLHPQCLCYKTGVQMRPDEFTGRLREWMNGGSWPEMDEYAGTLGTGREGIWNPSLAIGMADRLLIWLWGNADDIAAAVG